MRRSRLLLLALVPLVLVTGCRSAKEEPPKPVLMTPNSRLIYHDNDGHAIWTFCDRGARVYMTHSGGFWVVANGCLSGEP